MWGGATGAVAATGGAGASGAGATGTGATGDRGRPADDEVLPRRQPDHAAADLLAVDEHDAALDIDLELLIVERDRERRADDLDRRERGLDLPPPRPAGTHVEVRAAGLEQRREARAVVGEQLEPRRRHELDARLVVENDRTGRGGPRRARRDADRRIAARERGRTIGARPPRDREPGAQGRRTGHREDPAATRTALASAARGEASPQGGGALLVERRFPVLLERRFQAHELTSPATCAPR